MGFQIKIQEIDILIGKFVNQSWQNPDISLKRPKEAMVDWNESFLLNKNPIPFNEFGLSEPVLRTSTTLNTNFFFEISHFLLVVSGLLLESRISLL